MVNGRELLLNSRHLQLSKSFLRFSSLSFSCSCCIVKREERGKKGNSWKDFPITADPCCFVHCRNPHSQRGAAATVSLSPTSWVRTNFHKLKRLILGRSKCLDYEILEAIWYTIWDAEFLSFKFNFIRVKEIEHRYLGGPLNWQKKKIFVKISKHVYWIIYNISCVI